MIDDSRWTDAPIDRSAYWQHEAALLRKYPGVWRDVRVCPTKVTAKSTADDIRKGVIAAFRPIGTYTAVSRGHIVKAVCLTPTTEETP